MCLCLCVPWGELTHETVALMFFHLLQCSGLAWQGSCGNQSLENKAVQTTGRQRWKKTEGAVTEQQGKKGNKKEKERIK